MRRHAWALAASLGVLGVLLPGYGAGQSDLEATLQITAATQTVGTDEPWTVHYTATAATPGGGGVRAIYGSAWSVAPTPACEWLAPFTSSQYGVVGLHYVECPIPSSGSIAIGDQVRVRFQDVTNRGFAGDVTLRAEQRLASVIHSAGNEGVTIVPHPFGGTPSMTTDSNGAGAVTTYHFVFQVANRWLANQRLEITFPAGYTIDAGGQTTFAMAIEPQGTFGDATVSGTKVWAPREGNTIDEGKTVGVRVTHVRNPTSPGTTGSFALLTQDEEGRGIDGGSVPGITILGTGTTAPTTTSKSKTSSTRSSQGVGPSDTDDPVATEETVPAEPGDEAEEAAPPAPISLRTLAEIGGVAIAGLIVALAFIVRRPAPPRKPKGP